MVKILKQKYLEKGKIYILGHKHRTCKGVNKTSKLSIYDYIVYAHDDCTCQTGIVICVMKSKNSK